VAIHFATACQFSLTGLRRCGTWFGSQLGQRMVLKAMGTRFRGHLGHHVVFCYNFICWQRQAYPAQMAAPPGVGSIPANSDAQNVHSFRRRRFEVKLTGSPFKFYFDISLASGDNSEAVHMRASLPGARTLSSSAVLHEQKSPHRITKIRN
jgi:hypothetical protein